MSDIEILEEPFGIPLESIVGPDKCYLFKYIGKVRQEMTLIFLYKHINTCWHLNIDLKDQTYAFQAETKKYFLILKEEATQRVFL